MPLERGVLASFADPASAARAIRALRQGGLEDVRVAMPAHYPAVVEALGRPRSLLGWVTFPGAILGLLCGLGLTIGTSVAWPLVTGGKPIVSLPPFVIVTVYVRSVPASVVDAFDTCTARSARVSTVVDTVFDVLFALFGSVVPRDATVATSFRTSPLAAE